MIPFDLAEPSSLAQALGMLRAGDPSVRPIAGGTALMLMMKAGVFQPERLVSLRKLGSEIAGITANADGLVVGAMTTLAALEHSPEVTCTAPLIVSIMPRLANVRVRNVATIGGALAHGDPHMDLPPVLIALGASVRTGGPNGGREIAVEDLLTGYYETALAPGELIASVRVPAQGAQRAAYMKVTAGAADDWPALGVAVTLQTDGEIIRSARVVVGAATAKVTRLKEAEEALAGAHADDKTLARAGEAAIAEADIFPDVRGSAAYKRELLRVYIDRAVRSAMQGAQA
jgi:aerobic carbon-monoxide dehydrogenase medium subunit